MMIDLVEEEEMEIQVLLGDYLDIVYSPLTYNVLSPGLR